MLGPNLSEMSADTRRPRPVGDRLRKRLMAREGFEYPTNLQTRSVEVGGTDRTYSLAPAKQVQSPLLVALHGAGGTGLGMAALTDLADRGPSAGFSVAFPDGKGGVWNDNREAPRLASRRGIDDVAFLRAVVDELANDQVARPDALFLTGISNGALLAEHLARQAALPIVGFAPVAGTGTVASRQAAPIPRQPTRVVAFAGTHDRLVPYEGGPIGPLGQLVQRRAAARRASPGRGLAAPAEAVANDWAAANRCNPEPIVERLSEAPGGLPVTKLRWHAPGRPDVELYRVEGGGHTWPGGAPYLPERIIGPVAKNLDATGIILQAFAAVLSE